MKWIIDTDTGIDDASAIITAVNSGALNILGITCITQTMWVLSILLGNALKLVAADGCWHPCLEVLRNYFAKTRACFLRSYGTDRFRNHLFCLNHNIKLEPIHAL